MSDLRMVMWALIMLVVVIPFIVDIFYKFESTRKLLTYYFVKSMDEFFPHGLHVLMELSVILVMVTLCRIFRVPDYMALGAAGIVVWRKHATK